SKERDRTPRPRQLKSVSLVFLIRLRQAQRKRGSVARFRPHLDITAVLGSDVFDNTQPQPASARIARTGGINPEKPFKNARLQPRINSCAVVDNSYFYPSFMRARSNSHV